MSRHDSVRALERALELEATALDALHEAMVAQREAFAALRPATVPQSLTALDPLVGRVEARAAQRERAAVELAKQLGLADNITVSGLGAALPSQQNAALATSALRAKRAAGRVRVESCVSERLLAAARDARETVIRSLGADGEAVVLYDRAARAVPGANHGALVRGTV